MISENIQPSKIVVEGKTEVGRRPKELSIPGIKRLLDFWPRQFCHVDIVVFDNIGDVVKMPRDIKAV
jgi:hypothetical protein